MLKKTTLVISGLNALAALVPTSNAAANAPALANQTAAPVAALNQASLQSIEKSWLSLPHMCKARNAAFDPIVVGREELPAEVQDLYAQTVA